jgi:hypothetical protein
MAKAKKSAAVRKKSSKRGKARAKPVRKAAAKRATPKRTKSKFQPTGMSAKKSVAKKKRSLVKAEKRPAAEMSVETTTIEVIEESVPNVVAVTTYETVQIEMPVSADDESKDGEAIHPAATSIMAPDQSQRPEHEAGGQ